MTELCSVLHHRVSGISAPKLSVLSNFFLIHSANSLGSQDDICGISRTGFEEWNCHYLSVIYGIPSVMFTCDNTATNPQPTSTTSVTASLVAGVATSPARGSQATTISTTSTSSSIDETSSPTTGSGDSGGGSSDSGDSTGSSGLDSSDKIAIGVGLGVGIPSIIIGLVAWLWPRRRKHSTEGRKATGPVRYISWK